ncbi:hypothetical protein PTKIN_Ptkin06aG0200800 [Pterospermum kingtungense]
MPCYNNYSQFMMNKINKCKRSVHSFLGLSDHHHHHHHHPDLPKCGLGLITCETTPNGIDSSSSSSSLVLQQQQLNIIAKPMAAIPKKKDPGGIGFIDDVGGGVDGLMSCTESLGFESCDIERRVDDGGDGDKRMEFCEGERDRCWRLRKRRSSERDIKKFVPPPLSSLNRNGQPWFYLKPVRENGRLKLTEVRIQRPEVLRAVRENGRLRLYLVSSEHVCSKINDEEEEEEEENEQIKQEEEEEEVELQEEEEEEKVEELWKYRVNGEGFRRCHELVMSHHHHHHINGHHSLHVWRQPCVTR